MDVRPSFTWLVGGAPSVRQYHRALFIAAVVALVVAVGLLRAYVQAPRPLASSEILAATRRAVDHAVDAAVRSGGLPDGEAFVRTAVADELRYRGFDPDVIRIRRPNDLNPFAVFHFFVEVRNLEIRFELEGTRDPLLAIRLGLDVRIHPDPNHPYLSHREETILLACLENRYAHAAKDAPDFFARLENRTGDPYHYGLEMLLADGAALAVDHTLLETGSWGLTEEQAARYGR